MGQARAQMGQGSMVIKSFKGSKALRMERSIMEDNIGDFFENIPTRLKKYLEELPEDWDVVYDSVWGEYEAMNEEAIISNKLIYSKSNKIIRDLICRVIGKY